MYKLGLLVGPDLWRQSIQKTMPWVHSSPRGSGQRLPEIDPVTHL